MAKPQKPDDRPVTEKDVSDARRRFERSDLYRNLISLGTPLEEIPIPPSNFRSIDRVQSKHANDSNDIVHTIIGRELSSGGGNRTKGALRILRNAADELLAWMSGSNHSGRAYWCGKEYDSFDESKAKVETVGQAETISVYAGVGVDEVDTIEMLRDSLHRVLEKWEEVMRDGSFVEWEAKEQWLGKMNWNRNSGWPYNMPISEERFRQIDLPNFWSWLTSLGKVQNREQREAYMETAPSQVPNTNQNIYTMFFRPTDRVIHGIELLFKAPGAFITKNTTENLRGSRVSWIDIPTLHQQAASALSVDDAVIMADDIKKYDRNFPRGLMNLVYDVVDESDFMKSQPVYRQMILSLLYLFTKDAWLHMSTSHRVRMVRGLPSGHPLTQWIGSLVHLAIYEWFTEHHGLDIVWEKVLSDDGIRVVRGMTLEEADDFVFNTMADEIGQFGFSLHPEKTKVVDPHANVISMGYRTDIDREVLVGDSTFFLKQFMTMDLAGCYGNPFGAIRSFTQTERPASDEFREEVLPNIVGYDIGLGGRIPSAVYDLARLVDVIASVGRGNPLYDDFINFVPNAWPGWEKRGVKILEETLSQNWRSGNIRYAGGTVDGGIARLLVVEDLLTWEDREPLWLEQPFRKGGDSARNG